MNAEPRRVQTEQPTGQPTQPPDLVGHSVVASTGAVVLATATHGPVLFTILWVGWVAAFAVIEGIAIFNKGRDDTLSEKIRDLFRTDTRTGRTIWVVVIGAGAGLLAAHILSSGLTWWR